MFNVHIGLPGIAPNLLHTLAKQCSFSGEKVAHVLSTGEWRNNLRHIIIPTKNTIEVSEEEREATASKIQNRLNNAPLAISQHAVLGGMGDSFRGDVKFPQAKARISQLTGLLYETPFTMHILICNQAEYAARLASSSNKPFPPIDGGNIPSWANLVKRIQKTAPNWPIVVWDFDDAKAISLLFVVKLLNISADADMKSVRDFLVTHFETLIGTPSIENAIQLSDELVENMDMQYEADLATIATLPDVTFVSAKTVPEIYRISPVGNQ